MQYSDDIITNDEFNIIFAFDIGRLDYPSFIKKHGHGCFDVLTETNRSALKRSFIAYAKNTLSLLKLKDHAAEIDFFKFNDSIYYLVVSNETSRLFNNLFSIETFIERTDMNS